jgi:hypothetical protein
MDFLSYCCLVGQSSFGQKAPSPSQGVPLITRRSRDDFILGSGLETILEDLRPAPQTIEMEKK